MQKCVQKTFLVFVSIFLILDVVSFLHASTSNDQAVEKNYIANYVKAGTSEDSHPFFSERNWSKDFLKNNQYQASFCSDDFFKDQEESDWKLLDGTAICIGSDILSFSQLHELIALEEFFNNIFKGSPLAYPFGLGSIIALAQKGAEMKGKSSGANFKKIVEFFEEKLATPSKAGDFNEKMLKTFGFSLPSLEKYFSEKELAIGLLKHYDSVLTSLLEKENVVHASSVESMNNQISDETEKKVYYDLAMIIIEKNELDAYMNQELDITPKEFTKITAETMDETVLMELKKLKKGERSQPVLMKNDPDGDYFVVICRDIYEEDSKNVNFSEMNQEILDSKIEIDNFSKKINLLEAYLDAKPILTIIE